MESMRKLKMQSKPDSHQNLKLSEKIGKKNMKKKKEKKKKKKHEMQGPSTPNLLLINLSVSFTFNQKKKNFLYLFNGLGEYPGLICDFTPTFISKSFPSLFGDHKFLFF